MKKLSILFVSLLFATLTFAQLHLLNDEFDDATTISNWQNVNVTEGWNATQLEAQDINTTEAGQLFMMPYTTGWYRDRRAPLLYKMVNGDFVFTTQVAISNRNGTGIPSSNYSLAGPMIRRPKTLTNGAVGWMAGEEDYIFLSAGYADENHHTCPGACPPPHFEVKNTTDSGSNLTVSPLGSQVVTIRMVRIGAVILVLYQTPGNDFVVHRRYLRNDFPAEMQVGLVTYTDWNKVFTYSIEDHNQYTLSPAINPNINDLSSNQNMPFNPDLEARFDFARFDEVTVPEELEGVDLFNEATEEELLSFLGYASAATLPIEWSNFEAISQEKNIRLNWSTASEINNKGFDIQRSEDGKTFKTIAFQVGKGTSQSPQDYTFIDENVQAQTTYYYRLKQIDFDGTHAYSAIKTAFLKQQDFITHLTPQPVQSEMELTILSEIRTEAEVLIYNIMGQQTWQQSIQLEKGQTELIIPTDNWKSGMYQIVIDNVHHRQVLKMMKI